MVPSTPNQTPGSQAAGGSLDVELPGIDAHPHARAVLAPALRGDGGASHAYLFHGPSGTGKRAIAQAFAAALLADDAHDASAVRERIARGAHPDVTWVKPSGAAEMLVADIEEPVVAGATRTPFESARRVFVIEAVDTMNDQAANRMLKTLEEPPDFVHLLLLTDRREDVLATIASRCQPVRFDPLPPARIAEQLGDVPDERAQACARLALGDAGVARAPGGRAGARRCAPAPRASCARRSPARRRSGRGWRCSTPPRRPASRPASTRSNCSQAKLELVPAKERKRYERESLEARRRGERRARTQALEEMLRLSELWLRDVLCVCEDAPDLVYAVDRREQLAEDARGRDGASMRAGHRARAGHAPAPGAQRL